MRAGLAFAAMLLSLSAGAQTAFWKRQDAPPVGLPTRIAPASRYTLLRTDVPAIADYLQTASRGANRTLDFPLPDGQTVNILLERVDVLIPALAAAHPEIQTFKGVSADGLYTARLTVSPYGASARIGTPEGLVYVQPLQPSAPEWSAVFFARDADRPVGILCGVENAADEEGPAGRTSAFSYGDANLRTYVLAVAATGEYTVWAGGGTANQSAALAQITTAVNNVNAIYERDLGITFSLNSPAAILFTDSTTDPYSRTLSGTLLTSSDSAIDALVGVGNYDLGHVFGAQWSGGLAQRPSVCGSSKGRAASGLDPAIFTATGPSGPVFEGTVAHEIGHQFNATHSYAANNGGCGSGNISAATGWEPGGGSTIMAYAGTCTGNSYQNNSDLYFHAGNLSQMGAYMIGAGNACATLTTPGNAPPVLVASTAFTIPHSTPFRITASATDADNSALTYTHEQVDAVGGTGISTAPVNTSTTDPQFRSFFPGTSATRYLPNLASLFSAAATPYEVLPAVARTMNFRATARDNNAGFGRTSAENVAVTTSTCGPFSITSQTSATSLTANGTNTVTVSWNTASCVTCANVQLLFTRDRGATFSTVLASTPNDGSETFMVPNLATCDGRLYLECTSAPFFNVNAAAVTISSSCAAEGSTFSPSTALSVPAAGDAALNQTLAAQYGTQYSSPITGSIATTDAQSNLAVLNNGSSCANFGGNVTRYDSYTFYPSAGTTYTFNATGSTSGLVYNLYEGSFTASSPCTNLITSSGNYTGSVTLSNSISGSLCRGKQYTLVVMSFSAGSPTLPAPYSVAVSGGNIFSGTPNPALNYAYVIVNSTSGNIVAIQSTGNMTNATIFPTGFYTVYGLSTGSTASSLNTTYAGTSFAAFNTAVLSQTGGLCASFSSNARSITINPTALTLTDARLEARLTDRRAARTSWTIIGAEKSLRRYELERSYDGNAFETAAVIATRGSRRYEMADHNLREDATGVHYRVVMRGLNGEARYSASAFLPFEGASSPSLAVAPNPLEGDVLRAEVGAAASGTATIVVLDATGRAVASTPVTLSAGKQRIELPLSGLSAGVYLLRVDGAGMPLQVRFVKSK